MNNIIKSLNWVDFLVVILLFRSTYIGLKKGVWIEIFKFLGILTALFFGLSFYEKIGSWIAARTVFPESFAKFFVFIVILAAIIFTFKIIRHLSQLIVKIEVKKEVDSVGGALLGLFRGIVVCSLILVSLVLIPNNYIKNGVKEKSVIAPYLIDEASKLHRLFVKNMPSKNVPGK